MIAGAQAAASAAAPISVDLVCGDARPDAALRLLCLPYAGGSAAIFARWPAALPSAIEPWAAELPGRGRRFTAPLVPDLDLLAGALAAGVTARSDGRPFALFGHSMGALLAFEVARALRRRGLPGPVRLVVSGAPAPHLFAPRRQLHTLPDDELITELRALAGTPEEVLASDDLMQLFLPVLRADFAACELYRLRPGPPLSCPITAFGGDGDTLVAPGDLRAWEAYTTGAFDWRLFAGGHFFLESAHGFTEAVAAAVSPCR